MSIPFPLPVGLLLILTASVFAAESATPRQWRVSEFTFTASDTHETQPLAVEFSAVFTGPDGSAYNVPGFWDGGDTWKLRFTPTLPGEWSYETSSIEGESVVTVEHFDSGVMRGGEAARRVDVPIRGATELRLVVDDAGDGTNYDHADWADAKLVDAAGNGTYLDTLQPVSATQGHGKLSLRKNIPGQPLRIGDREFERGLGTHANGEIRYRLAGGYERLQAWVGVDALVKEHGSVRFRVLTPRTLTERVGRRDEGLHGKQGAFTALPVEGENPLFRHGGILRVSEDNHYLTYADGTPFFWLGDTWWFCPSDLMPFEGSTNPEIESAYKTVIETRKRQGFTVIQMAFLDRINGASAFADFGRTGAVDVAFWREVDRYIDYANEAGLIPVIGMGWAGRPLSPADWRIVWRYMIARYGAHAITWLVCGEYNVRGAEHLVADTLALGQFIKDTDPYKRAMSIHPWAEGVEKRQAWEEPWYDFIMLQGGHGPPPDVSVYLKAYEREPTRPVLESECAYEGIRTFTDKDVRERACRAIQSGSFGYTYGSHGLWYPTQDENDTLMDEWGTPMPWWEALKRPGATQLGHLRAAYETVDWWKLQPRPEAVSSAVPMTEAERSAVVVYDFIEHFDEAKASNEHWCKLKPEIEEARAGVSIELHPKMGAPAVLAYPEIILPELREDEGLLLVLALGMNEHVNLADPKHPSDGVTYCITVNGEEVLREHRKSKAWAYKAIDVSEHAGGKMRLEFSVEAGENMNYDHARFRAPVILRGSGGLEDPLKASYTARRGKPVLAKAEGDSVFVIYFPADRGPHSSLLHGVEPDATYAATWHNPCTGEAQHLPRALKSKGTTVDLPNPEDDDDWLLILRKK